MFKSYKRILSYMKPYSVTFCIGLLIYSSQNFIISFFNALFLNRITAAVLEVDYKGVIYAVLLFLALFAGFFPFISVGLVFYINSAYKATRDVKKHLFRCFIGSGMESALSGSGEGIAALNTDSDTACAIFDSALAPIMFCLTNIVFSAVVVFAIDYRLGLISVVIGLVGFLLQNIFTKPLARIGAEKLTVNASSVKAMSDIFSGAIPIRAYNIQPKALLSFDRENNKWMRLSFKEAFIGFWQSLFTTLQGWLTLTGVFVLGGYLVATNRLSFPTLMMVPPLCQALSSGFSSIGRAWADLQAPLAACKRVTHRLDFQADYNKTTDNGGHPTLKPEASVPAGKLTVRHLSFQYASSATPVLRDIELDIEENTMVAVVGASGSGKSTLLKTLAGLYERASLDMRLGDMPYDVPHILNWRSHFAYVDQNCKLFDMTVAENIALGTHKPVDAEAIRQAAAAAHADTFIQSFEKGYETPCGEKGASMSGGQKQRLAIARALVRQAPVLIFDEATASLDAESEKQVMETINGLRGKHTLIITTHHLKNIVNADKIIVMENGCVVETGRHETLMQQDGPYKRLTVSQHQE